jgi:MftR C-terminal domain
MAKTLRWEQAIAQRLEARGATWPETLLAPKLALACFQAAYERWVLEPDQDLPALFDDSFAALAAWSPVSGALAGAATIGRYGKGPELAPSSAPRQRQAVRDGCP